MIDDLHSRQLRRTYHVLPQNLMKLTSLLTFVGVMLTARALAQTTPATGTIQGTVREQATDQPLPGVHVATEALLVRKERPGVDCLWVQSLDFLLN